MSATTPPPTESGRLPEMTENVPGGIGRVPPPKHNSWLRRCIGAHVILLSSGAAKVDLSPESCIFLRKHETLHKCSMVPKDHKKNRPQKIAPLVAAILISNMAPKLP